MSDPHAVLSFWFDRPADEPGTGNRRKVWFIKKPKFDRQIATHFLDLYEQAAAGRLDHWQTTAEGSLALCLLLDQFPRHLFRGQPQAFATDAKALTIAQGAIAQGFDQQLPPIQRVFFYLPLEHSENLVHQRQCVERFSPLQYDPDIEDFYTYAIKHLQVIERFGRFPHRNQILGRQSTPEEIEFLKQPGSSF